MQWNFPLGRDGWRIQDGSESIRRLIMVCLLIGQSVAWVYLKGFFGGNEQKMAAFPDAWMSELFARCDIASVVGEYVQLKPKGQRLWGCCPFHSEKTPSFSVTLDKQFYYCFGCHAGGDAIHFVMQIEKMSFVEAVKYLAQRVNLPLPEMTDEVSWQKERDLRDRLYAACKDAARFYYEMLKSTQGAIAKEYLQKRGIDPSVQVRFGLGYSPPSWDALGKYLRSKGYRDDELIQAGLSQKKGDRVYDAFRGRLMFPIIGRYQRVVGFGARALGDEMPKYLNTGENEIFNKRMNLYGINMLKGQHLQDVVLVEGYMDVISLHQYGVMNAVATLGTALTQQQAHLIKRYASTVYLAYDGDAAGQNATLRGMDILAGEGLNVRVIGFPEGQDPDDYIREAGFKGFEERKEEAQTLSAFKIQNLAVQYDLTTEDGREAFARAGSAFVATLSPLEQERYYGVLSRLSGYSVQALREEGESAGQTAPMQLLKPNRLTNIRYTSSNDSAAISPQRVALEQIVLKSVLADEDILFRFSEAEGLLQLEAHRLFAKALLERAKTARQRNGDDLQQILGAMPAEEVPHIAAVLALSDLDDPVKRFETALAALRRMGMEQEIDALQREADDERTELSRKLTCVSRIRELYARLDEIRKELRD